MDDLLDVIKRSDIEEIMRRHRPTDDGKDGSKERYAYIEWLGIYNAIKELPSVKYDSFCDVPIAEAAEAIRMYKRGELAHLKGREPKTDCPSPLAAPFSF